MGRHKHRLLLTRRVVSEPLLHVGIHSRLQANQISFPNQISEMHRRYSYLLENGFVRPHVTHLSARVAVVTTSASPAVQRPERCKIFFTIQFELPEWIVWTESHLCHCVSPVSMLSRLYRINVETIWERQKPYFDLQCGHGLTRSNYFSVCRFIYFM